MPKLKKDKIEVYYFKSARARNSGDLDKAIGYIKVVDADIKKEWGEITDHGLITSETKVKGE